MLGQHDCEQTRGWNQAAEGLVRIDDGEAVLAVMGRFPGRLLLVKPGGTTGGSGSMRSRAKLLGSAASAFSRGINPSSR